eukprot:GEMP01028817.1.p1 GENE.GEMP01028817.1~~GEMP01028817.1.p1  ORF type:complete len:386 (+),score=109.46 GEMP01028817.1:121-1158(+)
MAPIEKLDDVDPTSVLANPVVQKLIPLDDDYLKLEREYQRKIAEIQVDYEARQQVLLDQRSTILEMNEDDKEEAYGTPAIPNFWLTTLKNHPDVQDYIFEWDAPVMAYLKNILKEDLPDETGLNMTGFRLIFVFSPNPYFENEKLTKEYNTKEASPWTHDLEIEEIVVAEPIKWKDGQDVTVELLKKKSKNKKKKKSGSQTIEKVPRPSFFRIFFRSLKKGDEPPEDLVTFQRQRNDEEEDYDESDEEDEEEMMEMIMDDDYDKGIAFRESLIPFAIRWFTGEAAPEVIEDSDEEDDDEDDEDGDEDSDDDEESSSHAKKTKEHANIFAAKGTAEGEKEVECKQQ